MIRHLIPSWRRRCGNGVKSKSKTFSPISDTISPFYEDLLCILNTSRCLPTNVRCERYPAFCAAASHVTQLTRISTSRQDIHHLQTGLLKTVTLPIYYANHAELTSHFCPLDELNTCALWPGISVVVATQDEVRAPWLVVILSLTGCLKTF